MYLKCENVTISNLKRSGKKLGVKIFTFTDQETESSSNTSD